MHVCTLLLKHHGYRPWLGSGSINRMFYRYPSYDHALHSRTHQMSALNRGTAISTPLSYDAVGRPPFELPEISDMRKQSSNFVISCGTLGKPVQTKSSVYSTSSAGSSTISSISFKITCWAWNASISRTSNAFRSESFFPSTKLVLANVFDSASLSARRFFFSTVSG